jgi:hypothetical protein
MLFADRIRSSNSDRLREILPIVMLLSAVTLSPCIDLSWRENDGRLLSLATNHDRLITVQAMDDAGPFSVTLSRGRVVQVSIAGVPMERESVQQRAEFVKIVHPGHTPLQLTLTAAGGFTWQSRRPTTQSR